MIGAHARSMEGSDFNPSRREFLLAGALGATALIPAVLTRNRGVSKVGQRPPLDGMIPHVVGQWTRSPADGVLIPRGEEGEDKAFDEVVTRYYTSETAAPIMLLIAYGSAQTHNTQLHRPEVCYPGAGFKLQNWPDLALDMASRASIMTRVLTAAAPGRTEQILYWSRVGAEFPTSNLAQRWSVFRQTFEGKIPDGALIRISMIDPDHDAALISLQRFARDLVGASSASLRQLMTG